MKRFLFVTSVENAGGQQVWFSDAETQEEALAEIKAGGGEIYASEVEVTDLGKPEFLNETTLDDFGDFVPTQQRTWVGLTDAEIRYLQDVYDVADTDYAHAIETKLKEKNTWKPMTSG